MYPTTVYNDMTNYMGLYSLWWKSGFTDNAIQNNLKAAYSALTNHITSIISH
jgi:hypothetical protein